MTSNMRYDELKWDSQGEDIDDHTRLVDIAVATITSSSSAREVHRKSSSGSCSILAGFNPESRPSIGQPQRAIRMQNSLIAASLVFAGIARGEA